MSLRSLDMAQPRSDIYPSSHFFDGRGKQATEPAAQYKDPPNTPIPRAVQSIAPDADQLEQLLVRLIGRIEQQKTEV
ncbi:hypothetical protein N7453_010793 [Penicillium expansum]|nr:hypothetical protein N7453_010793 [Penicillium expansum]